MSIQSFLSGSSGVAIAIVVIIIFIGFPLLKKFIDSQNQEQQNA